MVEATGADEGEIGDWRVRWRWEGEVRNLSNRDQREQASETASPYCTVVVVIVGIPLVEVRLGGVHVGHHLGVLSLVAAGAVGLLGSLDLVVR